MLEILNSLNHTSPDNSLPILSDGFFNPRSKVFTLPSDGLPFIENLYFFCPGSSLILENSSIKFKFSSKYIASLVCIFCEITSSFIFKNLSKSNSIEFDSGIQTDSAEKFELIEEL